MSRQVIWSAITAFRLVTAEPERLVTFYEAIGFEFLEMQPIARKELDVLEISGAGDRRTLICGDSRIEIDRFEISGRSYPETADATDLVFQHFALVTPDMNTAWSRARDAGATPISRNGPVTLPLSSGGVTAVKFRDPDGHPLELLQFPHSESPTQNRVGRIGIDHSAISVSNIAASRCFYENVGLRVGEPMLNRGPTQVDLDDLEDVCVDVVPMIPAVTNPHLELLNYRHPRGQRHAVPLAVNDIAATRIVWRANREALIRDPDSHLHQLVDER